MHEWAIAEDILNTAEEALGGRKDLLSVKLTLGPLSGICADSLRFCFTEIAGQKGFGSPELLITELPARIRCRNCGLEYDAQDLYQLCPRCESLDREVLSGAQCILESLEIPED